MVAFFCKVWEHIFLVVKVGKLSGVSLAEHNAFKNEPAWLSGRAHPW